VDRIRAAIGSFASPPFDPRMFEDSEQVGRLLDVALPGFGPFFVFSFRRDLTYCSLRRPVVGFVDLRWPLFFVLFCFFSLFADRALTALDSFRRCTIGGARCYLFPRGRFFRRRSRTDSAERHQERVIPFSTPADLVLGFLSLQRNCLGEPDLMKSQVEERQQGLCGFRRGALPLTFFSAQRGRVRAGTSA